MDVAMNDSLDSEYLEDINRKYAFIFLKTM
jgi:hypothetical protein